MTTSTTANSTTSTRALDYAEDLYFGAAEDIAAGRDPGASVAAATRVARDLCAAAAALFEGELLATQAAAQVALGNAVDLARGAKARGDLAAVRLQTVRAQGWLDLTRAIVERRAQGVRGAQAPLGGVGNTPPANSDHRRKPATDADASARDERERGWAAARYHPDARAYTITDADAGALDSAYDCSAAARKLGLDVAEQPTKRERAAVLRELHRSSKLSGVAPHRRTTARTIAALAGDRARNPELWRARGLPGLAPAAPEQGGVRVLAGGVDTLHLAVYADVLPQVRRRLSALRDRAGRETEPVWLVAGELRFEVRPHGEDGYAIVLRGEAATLRLRERDVDGQPDAYVELRSAYLWRDGVDAAVAETLTLLRGWSRRPGWPRATVSRIDLAVDWQGWAPAPGDEAHAVTRARWASEFCDDGTLDPERYRELADRALRFLGRRKVLRALSGEGYLAEVEALAGELHDAGCVPWGRDLRQIGADGLSAAYRRGRRYLGFSRGRGDIAVRAYRKDVEIEASKKRWFRGVWSQTAGYDSAAPVWRLEYQLRGEALKRVVYAARGERAQRRRYWTGHEWWSVRAGLDGLWSYLTGRTGPGWFRLVEPGHERPDLAPLAAHWRALADVRWPGQAAIRRAHPVRRAPQMPGPSPAYSARAPYAGTATAAERDLAREAWLSSQVLAGVVADDIDPGQVIAALHDPAGAELIPRGHPQALIPRTPGWSLAYEDELQVHQLRVQALGTLAAYAALTDRIDGTPHAADEDVALARAYARLCEDVRRAARSGEVGTFAGRVRDAGRRRRLREVVATRLGWAAECA